MGNKSSTTASVESVGYAVVDSYSPYYKRKLLEKPLSSTPDVSTYLPTYLKNFVGIKILELVLI